MWSIDFLPISIRKLKELSSRLRLPVGWFRVVPFVGRLPSCSWKDLKDAGIEVLVAMLFATMPLWFLPLVGPYFFKGQITGEEAVRTGELFLFSAAIIGPLVYIITKNYGEKNQENSEQNSFFSYSIKFPYGAGFVFSCIAICIISSFAFLILKNPLLKDGDVSKIINYEGAMTLSWWTLASSVLIFYCATAYRNSLENITRVMPSQEERFIREWEEQK